MDREIELQVELLTQHADLGRLGRVVGTRELVIDGTPFVVAYKTEDVAVIILRVFHGAQRWPKRL